MRIGIDVDDTITNTSELLLEYLDLHGKNIDFSNPKNSKIDILRGRFSTDEVVEFMKKYASEIAEKVTIKSDAVEVIKRLKKNGHRIFIITARSEKYMKNIIEITKKYLIEKEIVYDEVYMEIFDKEKICLENNIEVMIDDSIEICEKVLINNVKPILFNSIVNNDIKTEVCRV